VEHPVTEGLTGVNLPSVQLQVAMGIALDRIPEIRELYGLDPTGTSKISFLEDEVTPIYLTLTLILTLAPTLIEDFHGL
jgi:hypothetical protein